MLFACFYIAGVQVVLLKVREEIKKRGARGIIGIGRKFRIMDDDNNGALNLAEFKKGMEELSISLDNLEVRQLFSHFDRDGDGLLSYNEFLESLRGEINESRLKLIKLAFTILDVDKNGTVTPEDMVERYDASQHPDVVKGTKTKEEALLEFLETFDVDGSVDGKVTEQEFINYYRNVSACIDSDDYFELVMRNAWRISGGEGWAANTSNK